MTHSFVPILMALALLLVSAGQAVAQNTSPAQQNSGEIVAVGDTFVRMSAVSENVVRVTCSKDKTAMQPTSFAVTAKNAPQNAPASTYIKNADQTTLTCGSVRASLSHATGKVTFSDAKTGVVILTESARSLEPAEVQGEKTFHCKQTWQPQQNEALYGLGQHQFGLTNLRGQDIELWQHNTAFAIPMLLSSKGYGIYWDNPSFTKFGDTRDFVSIPAELAFNKEGQRGGFTATPFTGSNWGAWNMGNAGTPRMERTISAGVSGGGAAPAAGRRGPGMQESALRWEGEVVAEHDGLYKFKLYASGGYRMWIDGRLVADHWRQGWLPSDDLASATFQRGKRHKIVVEWIKDGGTHCSLTWKPPLQAITGQAAQSEPPTSLWSQVGKAIDYYFIYGGGEKAGALDKVVAGYRQLTGKAPMMPLWAFGLWQSRERYETQQASLDIVKGFRDRKIPFDTIVQDWMYWQEPAWGSHEFDPARFPDPAQWVKDVHALNARVILSVWGKFYPGTDNYNALNDKGYLYPIFPAKDWVGKGYSYTFYDAFNAGARDMFWEQMNKKLLTKGFDGWWMDATEPDLVQPSPPALEKMQAGMPRTAAGTGASVLNAYPLMNSRAVYEGQRKALPDQRVIMLTRAAYAGEQRYAAAVWSGDVSSTWSAMKKQIAAGLGASISGMPYWTMDSGGFSVPSKFNNHSTGAALDEWRELNTRWLQFAAFVPIFRVHGQSPHREMWHFGGETSDAYKAQKKIDHLRYRLLPFWYSLAGDVTQHDASFMRPLVMDFPHDSEARDIADQYLVGSGVMVSPITEYKARMRHVYLPSGPGNVPTRWYDFWTGSLVTAGAGTTQPATVLPSGGMKIEATASYDQIPLHVRAGTILPTGPELQYTTEKKADPLTLWVYTGADGAFSLYEDDGHSYQYEKNAFSRIPITWNEATRTLTLGKRQGDFPGMLAERSIRVVFVSPENPVSFAFEPKPDKIVKYQGDALAIRP